MGPRSSRSGTCTGRASACPLDNIKAYVWLNVAAAQGVAGRRDGARRGALRLTPAELQEAQAEARRLSALYIPKAKPTQ